MSSNQVLSGDTNYFIAVFGIGLCSMFETHTPVQDYVDDVFFSLYCDAKPGSGFQHVDAAKDIRCNRCMFDASVFHQ